MLLTFGRRHRRARLTLGDAPFQLAPSSLPGGMVTYWSSVIALAISAVVSAVNVLG